MPAIPIVTGGISLLNGIMGARAAGKAAKSQQGIQNSQMDLMRQQTGLSNELSSFARNQHTLAEPALSKAMQYYMQLATGNRGAIQGAIAPDVAQLQETYRGAERGIRRSMGGASRDRAIADLYRQRAGQLGILPFQARQAAIGNMEQAGNQRMQNALSLYQGANSALTGAAYSGSASSRTGAEAADRRDNAAGQWGNAITGGGIFGQSIYDWYRNRSGKSRGLDTYGLGGGF